jgi:hypothetical protein
MPNSPVVVGYVRSFGGVGPDAFSPFSDSLTSRIRVDLDGRPSVFVDVHQTWVLERLRSRARRRAPVALTIDDRRTVTRVDTLKIGRVLSVERAPGRETYRVLLGATSRVHYVQVTDAASELLLDGLERAYRSGDVVAVSTDPVTGIIRSVDSVAEPAFPKWAVDVFGLPSGDLPPEEEVLESMSIMSLVDARSVVKDMRKGYCSLSNPTSSCLPFDYVPNYCYVVADYICRLLLEDGISAGKLWAFGPITFRSPLSPTKCRCEWRYHVAAAVTARGGTEVMVIDPRLFANGVSSRDTWRRKLGVDDTLLTPIEPYMMETPPFFIPSDERLRQEGLQDMRQDFDEQISCCGEPPYPCSKNCSGC